MIATILRAQFRSMRFGGRGTAVSILVSVIWYGLWLAISVVLGETVSELPVTALRAWMPFAFLGVCAYWQLAPVVSASMGSALDLRKLMAYPIPRGQLFTVEVLLRLTTAIEMLMVLTAGTVGLLINPDTGGARFAPRVLGSVLLFVLFNLLLSSGMRSVLERLLSRRKVREVLAIVVALIWVLPRFLISAGLAPHSMGPFGTALRAVEFPWSAAADGVLGISFAAALFSLVAWTAAAFWFGRMQFARSLRFDLLAAQATPLGPVPESNSLVEWFYRLPGAILRDPLAGIVEKELRSLARTPRFRTIFIMGFTFGLLVWFPLMAGGGTGYFGRQSPYFLIIVCVYALTLLGQVSYWNCFGFDGSATAFYFAAPQKVSTVLRGKNLASLLFIYLEVLMLCGITALLGLSHGWRNVVETLVVIGICSLYMLALGNLSSVNYPRPLHAERVSQGGTSGRFHGLVFLLYPSALLPVLLAYLARYALRSQLAFDVILALAGVLGAALYSMSMESAIHTAMARREQILRELSSGGGPVASD